MSLSCWARDSQLAAIAGVKLLECPVVPWLSTGFPAQALGGWSTLIRLLVQNWQSSAQWYCCVRSCFLGTRFRAMITKAVTSSYTSSDLDRERAARAALIHIIAAGSTVTKRSQGTIPLPPPQGPIPRAGMHACVRPCTSHAAV